MSWFLRKVIQFEARVTGPFQHAWRTFLTGSRICPNYVSRMFTVQCVLWFLFSSEARVNDMSKTKRLEFNYLRHIGLLGKRDDSQRFIYVWDLRFSWRYIFGLLSSEIMPCSLLDWYRSTSCLHPQVRREQQVPLKHRFRSAEPSSVTFQKTKILFRQFAAFQLQIS
jgi:hypothetical protein